MTTHIVGACHREWRSGARIVLLMIDDVSPQRRDDEMPPDETLPPRPLLRSLSHGWRQRCARCGQGTLFAAYLKVNATCASCTLALHEHRADDAPPYFTILIIGHIIVPAALSLEVAFSPPTWLHMAIWLPLTIGLSLWFLPRVKGTLVGLQWALRMHGFEASDADPVTAPPKWDKRSRT